MLESKTSQLSCGCYWLESSLLYFWMSVRLSSTFAWQRRSWERSNISFEHFLLRCKDFLLVFFIHFLSFYSCNIFINSNWIVVAKSIMAGDGTFALRTTVSLCCILLTSSYKEDRTYRNLFFSLKFFLVQHKAGRTVKRHQTYVIIAMTLDLHTYMNT